jgi:ubiquinone biosynthesis protein
VNWELLLDEEALASLLPGEYSQFARPVKEGLVVFLSGLPQGIQESILAEQAALPIDAPMAVRLGGLALGCPVLHKLGQILARDHRLASELRQQFRQLESLTPTVGLDVIQDTLARELGPLDRRGITLAPPAIAEASVAVVIPFRLGAGPQSQEGVFKILKPGIEERLHLELELLGRVGVHLDQECEQLGIPQLDYGETFEQVRHKLASEVLLEREQYHLIEAQTFYTGQRDVQIPRLFGDHCTSRVSAMERVHGEKVTDHLLQCPWEKQRLANLVARALVARPLFAWASRALFHSDPHAGNLIHTTDGRLAILDWSLVGHLGETERVAMVQILLAALTLQPERIVNELEGLAERKPVNRSALAQVVSRWLRRYRHGQLPGMSWLVGMLDEAVQVAGLRVSGDMLLFRKSLLTLEGVVNDIGAEGHWIDDVALGEFLRHFVGELPVRLFSWPSSRKFATRLSNWDLAEVMFHVPWTVAQLWTGYRLDLVDLLCQMLGQTLGQRSYVR